MESKRPILSICIPTFNGGSRLKLCLDALQISVSGRKDVEIIVSDNCSDDTTQAVLSNYKEVENIFIYRNSSNVGFNGNLKLLIWKYAVGKYCWIIGDDDIVDSDVVNGIVSILDTERPSFISLKHRVMRLEDLNDFRYNKNEKLKYIIAPYFECLDINASSSNVLGTFMSSQIFLLDRIKTFNMDSLGDNTWTDFRTTFPNSYMMTNTFYRDSKCCCISTPVITALDHEKSWDDKLDVIITQILPSYFDYCLSLSNKTCKLERTRFIIFSNVFDRNLLYFKSGRLNQISLNFLVRFDTLIVLFERIYLKVKRLYKS